MADIVVQTFTIPNWRWGGSTAKLRLYSEADWTDSAGVPHIGGTVGSPVGFYQEVDLTISSATITVPQFTTQSTSDSLDRPTVRISAVLFDSSGARRETLFAGWFIPANATPTQWAALRIVNLGRGLVNPPDTYLTSYQIQDLINLAIAGVVDGSGTANKVAKFTATAVIGDSSITDTGTTITLAPTAGSVAITGTTPLLQLGGTSSSFPALKRSSTTVDVRLADDSAYATLASSGLAAFQGTITTNLQGFLHTATWNNGATTFIGIQSSITNTASAAASQLIDLRVGGTTQFSVSPVGTVLGGALYQFAGTTSSFPMLKRSSATLHVRLADDSGYAGLTSSDLVSTGNVSLAGTGAIFFGGLTSIWSISDGVMKLADSTFNAFNRLTFGGISSAFPAIKRSAATLQFRLADDSDFASVTGGSYTTTAGIVQGAGILGTSYVKVGTHETTFQTDASGNVIVSSAGTGTGFNLLKFGGITTSFPALKRSSAALHVRLADDSDFANLTAAAIVGTSFSATTDILAGATGTIGWTARTSMTAPSDGVIRLSNNAANDFGRLQFGGTTSSYPSLKRNANVLDVRLADDSANGLLGIGGLQFYGSSSGTITVLTNAAAGTWTLTLPTNDGDSGQFLQTNGSGATSWAAAAGGGGSILTGEEMSGVGFIAATTTEYTTFNVWSTGDTAINSTEGNRQMAVPVAGTLSNFFMATESAQPGTGTLVITVRKNGASSALTFTIGAGAAAGNFFDNVNTVSLAAGDVLGIMCANNASSNSASIRYWGAKFTPS